MVGKGVMVDACLLWVEEEWGTINFWRDGAYLS